ncbi:hypothetical protein [Capnocytophaga canimorsus]|uniref:hypothetical protein n=1 Tax=Capnocytophaga canimorsus TaxID=28188 RepID=UPI000F6B6924|nr:hypothetical protein [Capnocytophaga canimorsus]VEJ18747.1 Uncharacterised protein [Capnocytophaga canimorsus]
MKFIHQINQYLLARYPSLWNTKIVWMLCVAFVIHIFFFTVGYFFFQNPETLQTYDIYDIYYSSAFFIFQIIISLILLVVWLMQLFKNNAFKHFYPMSSLQLFGQFLQFMVIVFACLSFHLSFRLGNYVFAHQRYDDVTYTHIVQTANKAYPFLFFEIEDYMPDMRKTPHWINDLYCQTDYHSIDTTKPYLTFADKVYQFYRVYAYKTVLRNEYDNRRSDVESAHRDFLYTRNAEDSVTIYHKKEVVDVSDIFVNAHPNLRNFSKMLYVPYGAGISYTDLKQVNAISNDVKDWDNKTYEIVLNENVNHLLDKEDEQAIKNIMKQFLSISRMLRIDTNLDLEGWFNVAYRPQSGFNVQTFFRTDNYSDSYYDPNEYDQINEEDAKILKEKFKNDNSLISLTRYKKLHSSNYYYSLEKLKNALRNIDELRGNFFDAFAFNVYVWISVMLALLLFCYRVFRLKSLLLGVVSLSLISLAIGLILLVMNFTDMLDQDYNAVMLVVIVYLLVLVISQFMPYERNKTFASILMNVSVLAFPLVFFLVFLGVDMYQKKQRYPYIHYAYDNHYLVETYNQETLLDWLGVEGLSLIVFLGTLIFVLFYIRVIMRWKATSE